MSMRWSCSSSSRPDNHQAAKLGIMVARRSGGEALCMNLRIANIDPQGEVALSLLGEAAADVRPLYSSASGSAPPPVTRRVSVMSYGWI